MLRSEVTSKLIVGRVALALSGEERKNTREREGCSVGDTTAQVCLLKLHVLDLTVDDGCRDGYE